MRIYHRLTLNMSTSVRTLYGNQLSGQFPTSLNNTQTSLISGDCTIKSGNSLCQVSGQTFPSGCSSDLSGLPLCPIITTTTTRTTTTTTTKTTTSTSTTTSTNTSTTTTSTSTTTSTTSITNT